MNADWLLDRFVEFGRQSAVICGDHRCDYGRLLKEITKWTQILTEHGITAGEAVALRGDATYQMIALMIALAIRGNIVVPIAKNALAASDKEPLCEVAHVESIFDLKESGAWELTRRQVKTERPLLFQKLEQGEAGLIIFSSGTTGDVKASLHRFPKLISKFRTKSYGYRTLLFLLPDHIGGINTVIHCLANGGTVIIPASRTAGAVAELIARERVELLPTTPTFLNMLLISRAYVRYDLSSLKLVTYGTEPMPEKTLQALRRILPGVRIKQTYGLTETGILATKSRDSSSLFMKIGGQNCFTKIVNGILWIKNDGAMLGYVNRTSPFDEEGWLNTGDCVEEHDGYLRVLGRSSDVINVGGEKVFPAEVENTIMHMENIVDVIVSGKRSPVTGQVVVAAVQLSPDEEIGALTRRIRQFCASRLKPFQIPVFIEIATEPLYGLRFKKLRSTRVDGKECKLNAS
jgi:long-chain acyl-CoA synthetase